MVVDVELYGGYRGLLLHIRAMALYTLGSYRRFDDINWGAVGRLVFVCKGNICRSPYAAARARALGVRAVSYGLEASEGALADPTAARAAGLRGLDISRHQASKIHASHVQADDLIAVFEPVQLSLIDCRCGKRAFATGLLGTMSAPIRPHIQDPYGRSARYFQQCFAIIDANVAQMARLMMQSRPLVVADGGVGSKSPIEASYVGGGSRT